jgi:hypothetical protein
VDPCAKTVLVKEEREVIETGRRKPQAQIQTLAIARDLLAW